MFFLLLFSSTLSLQVGNRLVFCGGFSCLFLSFGVSCLLAWLRQPIFVCHQHLWFGLSFFATGICGLFFLSLPQAFVYSLFLSRPFSAVGIRVRLFVFALLALVSGFRLWSKSHWTLVFRHKVYVIALSQVLATQMGVTEAQHQSQLVWIVQIWPIFASQRVDSAGTRASLNFGLLVSCYSLLQHSEPACLELFVDHTHTHSMNNQRWQPHWLSRPNIKTNINFF